jgi:glycosyltransferase involved in cell wall biosynthesis
MKESTFNTNQNSKSFIIILPFFNESELIIDFLNLVTGKLQNLNENFKLLFVNDGSTDNTENLIKNHEIKSNNINIEIIELNSNSGHQNAIRQGLIYVKSHYLNEIKAVIIMDSDGEDNPDAISELIIKKDFDVVFVSRGQRKESNLFKISYYLYKILFKLITGKHINFGNFSMISPKVLEAISDKHFFHYSSFLSKQKFKIDKIKYDRNKRLKGKSKMGFKNLLLHALKSLVEYHEELIYFQIKVFVIMLIMFGSILSYIIYSKFISNTAVLGWSSSLFIGLINGLLIIFSSIIISTLLITIKNTLDQKNIKIK